MQILDRLFGRKKPEPTPADDELDRMVARVHGMYPRLRHAHDHDERLRSAMARSLAHLRKLVADFPSVRAVTVQDWGTDPYVRAFFAAANDIPDAIGRSRDLRAFFTQTPDVFEAHAVLGMDLVERQVLGASHEGGVTRMDVPQTTVSFTDHQFRICGGSVIALRDEIVARLVDQLGIEALATISAEGERRDELQRERALLTTRLRILERQGAGMRSMAGGGSRADPGELARLQTEMDENSQELRSLGSLSEIVDRHLEIFCQVFSDPENRIHVQARQIRLNRMNVMVTDGNPEDTHVLDLQIARVPGDPPRERAFAIVRVARTDMPAASHLLDQAAGLLG
ncbi:hypothetical protein WKW79_22180 [Variovorax robiniae]|uniref:Uncharacterized protein n=1 Tax=Variovorax robiniae TaxID=1836199 RepID=A0ABU8XDZ6_9BURK